MKNLILIYNKKLRVIAFGDPEQLLPYITILCMCQTNFGDTRSTTDVGT